MKTNKLTAVIPVRKGSQRVKNKNLKPFANTTLLDIKIETLKKVAGLDEIVVTSDSDKMLDIARKHNITFMLLKSNRWEQVPVYVDNKILRPDWIQPPTDTTLTGSIHVVRAFEKGNHNKTR